MRVLVVEDEVLIAEIVQDVLLDAGHHVIALAPTEERALEVAAREPPQLAFVDFHLRGGGTGDHVARQLRDLYGTLVVFLSGDPHACREKAMATGALGCLAKPFADEDILATVAIAESIAGGGLPRNPPDGLQLYSYVV